MDRKESRRQFGILTFLYLVLLAGQLILLGFVYLLIRGRTVWYAANYHESVLYSLLPVLLSGIIIGIGWIGWYRSRKLSRKLSRKEPDAKVADYFRETRLFQLALLEGVNIYSLVVSAVSLSIYPLVYFGAGLLIFIFLFPSGSKMERTLGNTGNE